MKNRELSSYQSKSKRLVPISGSLNESFSCETHSITQPLIQKLQEMLEICLGVE